MNTIDPQQLQRELQRAFDATSERIKKLEETTETLIRLHGMTLRIFMDLHQVSPDEMIAGLRAAAEISRSDVGRAILEGLCESFTTSHGQSPRHEPNLRVVPTPKREDDPDSDRD